MTKTCVGVSLAVLLSAGVASAGADEPVLPFHATLQATEDCDSLPNPAQCLGFDDWSAECLAKGYNQAFQAVRTGYATHLGRVSSFERGCRDALTFYANALFDFAGWGAPLNPPPATGTFTITGGTGRYGEARGSGTLGNVFGEGNPGWIIYLDGFLQPRHGHR
jgi:hypothetical protein